MTAALISSLAQIHSLKVTSRTSIMRFKGTTKTLPEIGGELGVDAILVGSVQRAGGRVRISAQVIRASTDTHLWAKEFDRDITDVLALEADVARAIAEEIKARVTPEESSRLARTRTVSPEAHDAYLLGRHHYWRQSPEPNSRPPLSISTAPSVCSRTTPQRTQRSHSRGARLATLESRTRPA